MSRLRAFFKKHPLWLGFVAAVTPLALLLGLQYLWLVRLQKTSAIAQEAYLGHFMDSVASRVEYFYRTGAERSLDVPAGMFRDFDREQMARYFKKKPVKGARDIFIVHFTSDNRSEILFHDPYRRTMVVRDLSRDESRAITAAFLPLAILRYERSRVETAQLTSHEQDPRYRILLNPITDDASRLIGIAGAILDDQFFADVVLPREVDAALRDFFEDGAQGELIVTVHDGTGKLVYSSSPVRAAEPASADDDDGFSRPFPFLFKDWRVSIKSSGLTPEEWARVNFGINMTLGGLLAVILVGGVALAFRAASRELRVSQMKSTFVSNVSHELRTPLASIRVFGEFLRLGRVGRPEKVREYGEYIESESRRLTQLINNILDFSKIESDRKTYEFEPADLSEIVSDILRTFDLRLRHMGFEIDFLEPDAPLPQVSVDRDAIGQVVHNLLDNAVKYSGDSRRIVVRLGRHKAMLTLSVQDFGIGIPRAEQKKIFERFHRVSTGLIHDVKGSGLGLAIVEHVVKAHRGRVKIESAPGQGSTFTIALPVSATAESAAARGERSSPSRPSREADLELDAGAGSS